MRNKQQREEILEKGIPPIDMSNIHYCGIKDNLKANPNKDEAIEQSQSSTVAHEEENN